MAGDLPAGRRLADHYRIGWEAVPLLLLVANVSFTVLTVMPVVGEVDPREGMAGLLRLHFAFLPVLSCLIYMGLSVAAVWSCRVADPARDVNWLLARIAPDKVMATPERRERYRGRIVRILFLGKFFFMAGLLALQIYRFRDVLRG